MLLTPRWKIEMVEKDGKHFYTKDGESSSCVGVTTPLGVADKSMALVPWAAKSVADYWKRQIEKISKIEDKQTSISYSLNRYIDKDLWVKRSKKQ